MPKPKSLTRKLFNCTRWHSARRVFFAVLAQIIRSQRLTPVFCYARGRVARAAGVLAGLVLMAALGLSLVSPVTSTAATSSNLNFQARLQASSGAIVPDGNYNLQFKLYNASSGGSALWAEDYLNSGSHGVTVSGGYLSVNLGSLTAFPGNINWDQDMYVTMNVGGTSTGSPSWDGEMNPRLKLTAVPYAFQSKSAGQLQEAANGHVSTLSFSNPSQDNSIVLPDASGTVCLQNSTDCGFMLAGGDTNSVQNGTGLQGDTNFNIRSASTSTTTAALQALTGQSANLLELRNDSGAVVGAFGPDGSFSVQSSDGSKTLLSVNSNTGDISIGNDTLSSTIQIGNTTGTPAQTINIGNNATVGSVTTVNLGSTIGTSATNISGGTGGVAVVSKSGIVWDAQGTTSFTTPAGSTVSANILSPVRTAGNFEQILTLGLSAASHSSARGIAVFDARTQAHQASIGVFSPNEASMFGLSWNGSNGTAYLDVSGSNNIGFNSNGSTLMTLQANGNLGLGTGTANYKLDVDGTGHFTGDLTVDGDIHIQGGVNFENDIVIGAGGNSDSAFQVQNASGQSLFNVDSTNKVISVGSGSAADMSPWSAVNSLPVATGETGQAYYNGYIYVLGGANNSGTLKSNLYYAKVNSDGSLGTWKCQGQNSSSNAADYCGAIDSGLVSNSNTLPSATASPAVIAGNGYLYMFGGYNGSYLNTTYSAKINSDGSVGSWSSQGTIPHAVYATAATTYGSSVYLVGGKPNSSDAGTTYLQFAKLGPNGTLGNWDSHDNALSEEVMSPGVAVANGFLYAVGGKGSGSSSDVYYMKLGNDGTPAATFTLNTNQTNTDHNGGSAYVANGNLYVTGHLDNGGTGTGTEYAKLNDDGSLGSFTTSGVVLPEAHSYFGLDGINVNGYFYAIGGYNNSQSWTTTANAYVSSVQRLRVTGVVDLLGTSLTGGDAVLNGSLKVKGPVSFEGSLSVNSDLTIDSGVDGESGFNLAQLRADSAADNSFTGILGVDADGNVGLVGIDTISSQLMDYWDDLAWDTTNNRLGIGNDTPSYKLDVKDSNVGGYVARIQNTSTATSAGNPGSSANGLLIQLGADNGDRTTGNYFIGFAGGTSGAGTIAGKIQGGSGGVAYTTSGADYAEYFKANPNDLPQPGDIVSLDPSTAQGVVRSGGSTAPFGIISANPGFLGNGPICATEDANCDSDYQKYNVIVGMNGQLPTKVSVSNGAINIGDPIMASSTAPGVGVKATGYSRIIGYAEEATGVDGVIKVLLQPGIYDPVAATSLQGSGNPLTIDSDLHVTGNTTLEGTLNVGNALNAPSISVISANVSGDLTVVGSTTTGNLTVLGSATIQTLTINGVASFAGDTKLAAQVNTRQATLKSFKASKPITAGSAVILDNRDGHEGEITTTTNVNDSRVIGVAVTEVAHEGDIIDVAISGWVQVRVDTSPDGNGHAPAGLTAGQLISTSIGEGTVQTSGSPSVGSVLGKTTSKQDSNNFVWVMITLE